MKFIRLLDNYLLLFQRMKTYLWARLELYSCILSQYHFSRTISQVPIRHISSHLVVPITFITLSLSFLSKIYPISLCVRSYSKNSGFRSSRSILSCMLSPVLNTAASVKIHNRGERPMGFPSVRRSIFTTQLEGQILMMEGQLLLDGHGRTNNSWWTCRKILDDWFMLDGHGQLDNSFSSIRIWLWLDKELVNLNSS